MDSARVDSVACPFTRAGDTLYLAPAGGLNPGDTALLAIFYRGWPGSCLYYNASRRTYYSYISSTYYRGAFHLFPCQNDWAEKFTLDAFYTVDDSFYLAANGSLAGCDTVAGRTTFHWQETHPIGLQNTGFAFNARYLELVDSHVGIPLRCYCTPTDSGAARTAFATVPAMLDFYAQWTRTQFPFGDEKCGYMVTNDYMGMEHQTAISLGYAYLGTGCWNQSVIAHELFHQWFGNHVTPVSREEHWLAEGPASYFECMWVGNAFGPDSFRTDLDWYGEFYIDQENQYGPLPLSGADPLDSAYSGVIYGKGAWVMHMLRFVMGDSLYSDFLGTYLSAHADSSAKSQDLEDAAAAVYGDVDWFFCEWVYDSGHPLIRFSWSWAPDTLTAVIEQLQTLGCPVYEMPVEIGAFWAGDSLISRVWMQNPVDTLKIPLSGAPDSVAFDPHGWLLKEMVNTDVGERPARVKPGPVAWPTITMGLLHLASPPATLYDVSGRVVRRVDANELDLSKLAPGVYHIIDSAGARAKVVKK